MRRVQVLSSDRQRQLYDLKLDGRLGRVMAPDSSSPCALCLSRRLRMLALLNSCFRATRLHIHHVTSDNAARDLSVFGNWRHAWDPASRSNWWCRPCAKQAEVRRLLVNRQSDDLEWAWGLGGLARTPPHAQEAQHTALDRLRGQLLGDLRAALRHAYLGPK